MENSTTEATKQAARTAIEKIAGTFGIDIVSIQLCTVVTVDYDDSGNPLRTCSVTPVSGPADTTIEDVLLTPDQNDGTLNIPTIGSTVAVAISNIVGAFVFAWSDLDKIIWKGGNYGGLVKLVDDADATKGLLKKINNLENDINNLKTAFNNWIVAPNDGGAALKAVSLTWAGSSLTPTVRADLENITMLQGNK